MFRFSFFSFLLPRRRRVTQLAGAALLFSGVMQAQATQRIEFSPDPPAPTLRASPGMHAPVRS
ncbi:Uncharacterised protein [Serratia marcescens]|uniref:Uncharacterized protein n=1 Tax=Serratia marcescens TaxID=615 RepID=A0A379ZV67_SERMA|nr:Uncharacterised protein [Serratia marcescens]